MTSDPEILRAAHRLIGKHGEEAVGHAKKWAKECREDGDEEGRGVWLLIIKALDELLSEAPPEDSSIH